MVRTWIIEHGELDWKRAHCPIRNGWNVGTAFFFLFFFLYTTLMQGFAGFCCTSGAAPGLFWGSPLALSDLPSTSVCPKWYILFLSRR